MLYKTVENYKMGSDISSARNTFLTQIMQCARIPCVLNVVHCARNSNPRAGNSNPMAENNISLK